MIPSVNQGRTQECAFLVPKDNYIAVDECHVSNYGYICQKSGMSIAYYCNNNTLYNNTVYKS